MQINIGDHNSPVAGYLPVPPHLRSQLYWARTRARLIASKIPDADKYFLHLPKRRSLTELLADRSIWINYSVLLGGTTAKKRATTKLRSAQARFASVDGRS